MPSSVVSIKADIGELTKAHEIIQQQSRDTFLQYVKNVKKTETAIDGLEAKLTELRAKQKALSLERNNMTTKEYNQQKRLYKEQEQLLKKDISDEKRRLSDLAQKYKQLDSVAKQAARSQKGFADTTNKTSKTLIRHIREMESIVVAIFAMKKAYDMTLGMGFEYNKLIEQETIGLKFLIAQNLQGKDVVKKFALAQQEANKALKIAKEINVETPHTLGETLQIYKLIIPQVLKYGGTLKEAGEITKGVSILASSMGVEFQNLLKTVDSLMSGEMKESGLKRSLELVGLSQKAIKQTIKENGDLVGLFIEKLKQAGVAGKEFGMSWQGVSAKMKNEWDAVMGEIQKPLFDSAKAEMLEFAEFLRENKQEIIDFTKITIENIKTVGSYFKEATSFIWQHKEAVMNLATAYAVFKIGGKLGLGIEAIVGSFSKSSGIVRLLTSNVKLATKAQLAFNAAARLNPYVLMGVAIAGGVTILLDGIKKLEKEQEKLNHQIQTAQRDEILSLKHRKQEYKKSIDNLNQMIQKQEELVKAGKGNEKFLQGLIKARDTQIEKLKHIKELTFVSNEKQVEQIKYQIKKLSEAEKRQQALANIELERNEFAKKQVELYEKWKKLGLDSNDAKVRLEAEKAYQEEVYKLNQEYLKKKEKSALRSHSQILKQKKDTLSKMLKELDYEKASKNIQFDRDLWNLEGDTYGTEKRKLDQANFEVEIAKRKLEVVKGTEKQRDAELELQRAILARDKQQRKADQARIEQSGTIVEVIKKANESYKSQVLTTNQLIEKSYKLTFDRLTDGIADFVATGKADFKELTASILADLSRIYMKQAMLQALGLGGKSSGGTDVITGAVMSLFSANGNAFSQSGHISAYATGGVFTNSIVTKPTMFQYGGSNLGIMGEAGEEAILPLTRIGKDLGVKAQTSPVNIVVNTYTSKEVKVTHEEKDGKHYVTIEEVPEIVRNTVIGDMGRGSNKMAKIFDNKYQRKVG